MNTSRTWWPLVACLGLGAALPHGVKATLGGSSQAAFHHGPHLKGDVDCLQCHEGMLDPAAARKPTLQGCASCHLEDDKWDQPTLAEQAARGTPLRWAPSRQRDDVLFSHRRHVDVAELECQGCHKTIGEDRRAAVMTMEDCFSCHFEKRENPAAARAAFDCAACHR